MNKIIKNKYYYVYINIMKNAKKENRKKLSKNDVNYMYYENHHIIPKSIKSSDKKHNFVLLTAREHFIAHACLTKFIKYKNWYYKMVRAFDAMRMNSNKMLRTKINNKIFEKNRIACNLANSEYRKGKIIAKKENSDYQLISLDEYNKDESFIISTSNKVVVKDGNNHILISQNEFYKNRNKYITPKQNSHHHLIYDENDILIHHHKGPLIKFLKINNLPRKLSETAKNKRLYSWVMRSSSQQQIINNGNIKYKNWYLVTVKNG